MSKTYVNTILKRVVLLIVAFAVTALLAPNIHASSAYDEHAINFDRINNSRDFGGYRTSDGRTVKRSIFIRSAELSYATKSDLSRLKNHYQLEVVFDFRHPKDHKYCPDKNMPGVSNINLPIEYKARRSAKTPKKRYRTMRKSGNATLRLKATREAKRAGKTYTRRIVMDSYSQKQYSKYFDYLLNNEDCGGVLIHCVHGKDRTGVAAFMTLIALGVPEKTAYREYAMTNDWIKKYSPKTYRNRDVGVRTSELKYAVNAAKRKYGSMKNFLKKAYGLDSKDLTKLRQMYTE